MIVEVDACSSKKCGKYLCHFGGKLSISETTSLEKNFLIIETLHLNSSFLKILQSLSWTGLLLDFTFQQRMELYPNKEMNVLLKPAI